MKISAILAVLLLSFAVVGCTPAEPVPPVETNDMVGEEIQEMGAEETEPEMMQDDTTDLFGEEEVPMETEL